VAVVGLSHDHTHVIMNEYKQGKVHIIGIAETDKNLINRYKETYHLPDSLFFNDIETMLKNIKPDAVLAYNPISEHLKVAEVCLPMRIPLMVEKPLAINTKQAQRMAKLSHENNTPLLTNYETTWYASNQALKDMVELDGFGEIKKMIAKDGHQGPREIGCSPEFLAWLTDPKKNGGGALMDFGCYGANLMTWLQDGKRPIAVTAVTRNFKPGMYPKVEDDASIILEYENATGLIEASWDWPYSIKDLWVSDAEKSYHAVDGNTLLENKTHTVSKPLELTENHYQGHLTYLKAVLTGKVKAENDLSSLSNNLIVVEILEAAQESAKEGKRIELHPE
jgi:predicted dehydrogenase